MHPLTPVASSTGERAHRSINHHISQLAVLADGMSNYDCVACDFLWAAGVLIFNLMHDFTWGEHVFNFAWCHWARQSAKSDGDEGKAGGLSAGRINVTWIYNMNYLPCFTQQGLMKNVKKEKKEKSWLLSKANTLIYHLYINFSIRPPISLPSSVLASYVRFS